MNKNSVLLGLTFLFLLIGNVQATDVTSCQVINTSGEYYLQNDIVTNQTMCFYFNASDVLFDCQWHTITNYVYESSFASISENITNITIQNCIIKDSYFNASNINFQDNYYVNETITLRNIEYEFSNSSVTCDACATRINLWCINNVNLENITVKYTTQSEVQHPNIIYVGCPHDEVTASLNDIYLTLNSKQTLSDFTAVNVNAKEIYANNLYANVNSTWSGSHRVTAYSLTNAQYLELTGARGDFDSCYRFSNFLSIGNVTNATLQNLELYGSGNDCGRMLLGYYNYQDNITVSNVTCQNAYRCLMVSNGNSGQSIIEYVKSSGMSGYDIGISGNNTILRHSILNSTLPLSMSDYDPLNIHPQDNLIYDNYFLNGINASYISHQNYWNTTLQAGTSIIGTPYIGGNFYGDYSGCDSNGDGIGETPYTIDSQNIDYLPLTLTICITPPELTFVEPTPANGTKTNVNSITVNVSANENLSSCLLDWYNGTWQNITMTINGNYCYKTMSDLSDGTYQFRVYATDNLGNLNVTETREVTIDTTPPELTFVYPTPANASNITDNWIYVNVSANEDLSTCYLDWYNGSWQNVSMTINGNYCYKNMTDLSTGTYQFRVYATDDLGNMNVTETREVSVIQVVTEQKPLQLLPEPYNFVAPIIVGAGMLLILTEFMLSASGLGKNTIQIFILLLILMYLISILV